MQTSLARRERQRRSRNGRRGGGGNAGRAFAVALPLFLFGSLAVLALTAFVTVVGAYTYYSRDLPDPKQVFANLGYNQQTVIYDSTGKIELARFGDEQRQVLQYAQIPPVLIDATTSIEDKTFWTNAGFDPIAVIKAGFDTLTGRARGASTITQQLVRVRLLPQSAFTGSTYERKIKEIIQSIRLTQAYPGDAGKQQIIQAYLNQNFYGNQSYGIAAAAANYFGVTDLSKLTIAQAAILAAIPQSPTAYDLEKNAVTVKLSNGKTQLVVPTSSAIYIRRNLVLNQMLTNRVLTRDTITDDQIRAAMNDPVILVAPRTANWRAPHFVWQVRNQLASILCGTTPDTCGSIDTAGYRVTTTLNWTMQKAAEKWVKAAVLAPNASNTASFLRTLKLPDLPWVENLRGKNVHNGALVAMDYRTGRILAYVGSADYYSSSTDPRFQPQYDVLADGWRQPGSAMKPINYVTGIQDRTMTAASLFMDVSTDFGGGYHPQDADNMERGPIRLREALEFSLNIPAVKAAIINGPDHVFEMARKFGLHFQQDHNVAGATITLGTLEIHPLDLVGAYGALANGGELVPRTTILSITDATGKQVWAAPNASTTTASTAVVTPQAAFVIDDILAGNTVPSINPYWGQYQITDNGQHRPAAVKTGTTNDTKDLSAYGFLAPPQDPNQPAIAVGVWMGNSDNSKTQGVFSLESAAPLWQAFLTEVSKGTPIADFQQPDGIVQARVDAFSGQLPGPFTTKTINEYFISGTAPTKIDDTKVGLDVDSATGLLWQDGCTGPKQTSGFLDLSHVESVFPTWQTADDNWIARATKGPGVAGGPNKSRTSYFYDGIFLPYGASWGAPFAPTTTCTPTAPPPSVGPCDPLLGPCPTPCDPLLGPCPSEVPTAGPVVVPNVRCQTLDQASGTLTSAGLVVGDVGPGNPGGNWMVSSQDPLPGTVVPPGSSENLTLADPKKVQGCP